MSLHRVVSGGVVQTTAGLDSARCGVDRCPEPVGGYASELGVLEVLHVVAQAAYTLESQANLPGVQSDETGSTQNMFDFAYVPNILTTKYIDE